jgi:hypothetical protein
MGALRRYATVGVRVTRALAIGSTTTGRRPGSRSRHSAGCHPWRCGARAAGGGGLPAKDDRERDEDQNYDNQGDGRIPVHEGRPAVLHNAAMTTLELDDGEKAAMAELLKRTIAADPFPMSPRLRTLRAILAKLQPSAARLQPYPAPKPAVEPSALLRRMRGPRRRGHKG